mgnify:CR=1 FL=1
MDGKKIKKLFIFLAIPFLCNSQNDPIQSIGSAVTYIVTCPCKLFKYYEGEGLVYFCEETDQNIQYTIREKKYKDIIDRLLNVIDQNLYGGYKNVSDSIMIINKKNILQDYLNKNPNSSQVDFMKSKAIMVSEDTIRKLFFLDDQNTASFDVIVSGENPHMVKTRFNQLINSIMVKRKNFKKIF